MASQTAARITKLWNDEMLSKVDVINTLFTIEPQEADDVIAALPDFPLRLLREELDVYPNTVEDWAAFILVSRNRLEDVFEEAKSNAIEQRRLCRVVLAYRDAFQRRLQKLRETDPDATSQYRDFLFIREKSSP